MQVLRTTHQLFGIAVIAVAILAGQGCGSGQGSGGDVEVIEPRLVQTQSGERAFTGTLVNNGSRPVSIAQVEVSLYDENGSPVETVRIDVKDISAKDSVQFNSTIDSNRPFRQAQVKEILVP